MASLSGRFPSSEAHLGGQHSCYLCGQGGSTRLEMLLLGVWNALKYLCVCVCVNRNTRVISQLSEGWAGTGSSPSCIRKRAAEICTKRGWLLLGTSHSSPPNLALPSPDNLLLALKPQDVNRYSEKA